MQKVLVEERLPLARVMIFKSGFSVSPILYQVLEATLMSTNHVGDNETRSISILCCFNFAL